MQVRERMTTPARCCRQDDTLADAARLMWEHDCGSVPVLDARGVLVGMVTDRDACMASYTRGLRLDEIRVHTAMARKVWSCRAEDSLEAAELSMRAHQVRRLPVVDAGGKVIGILSYNDLVRAVTADKAAAGRLPKSEHLVQTLAAIGAPRQLAAAAASAGKETPAPAVLPRPGSEPRTAAAAEAPAAGRPDGKGKGRARS
jgi:CBS domain-containing protein